MQSTGHASTQAVSLVPIQGSAIIYATVHHPFPRLFPAKWIDLVFTYTLSVEVLPRASVGPRFRLRLYSSPTRSPALIQEHPPDTHPHRARRTCIARRRR